MSHLEPVLPLSSLSGESLQKVLDEHMISLNEEEVQKMLDMLGRDPTLTEATIFSIQGSEHCSYKSSRKFLRNLPTDATPVILGPKEDAGIVELCEINGEKYGIVFAHESHNSPSQLVPYEGAATGVGGICRDIACMGARVIGVLDALRFGRHNTPSNQIIARGVVEGIAGYGNPLGVPNLGGDCFFDPSFDGFTLVNVVALGLVKEKNVIHSYVPVDAAKKGYELIVVGKPSDRSGFGGASFSSAVIDEDEKEKNLGAVQEPNPFLERHLFASFQDLFKKLNAKGRLQEIALKDMGAGGTMCASVELVDGAGFGAHIEVEKIHTLEPDLPPHVLFASETQERFCFAVPPDLTQEVLDHFNKDWDMPKVAKGAMASCVGKVTDDGMFHVTYKGETICHAKANDVTQGLLVDREYVLPEKKEVAQSALKISDWESFLMDFFAHPNMASQEAIFENYDQTVQGNTAQLRNQGEAAICTPLQDDLNLTEEQRRYGFAVSVGGSATLGGVSSYMQGVEAVLTAISRVAAVGARPRALTDCLNYGNPEKPEEMGAFVAGITGVADAAKALHLYEYQDESTPFVSGNVSLYKRGNPSAIVSCLGAMPNVDTKVGSIPHVGDVMYIIGDRHSEIGGTQVAIQMNIEGNSPQWDLTKSQEMIFAIIDAAEQGLISSSKVIAQGGVISSLFTMSFQSALGFEGDFSSFSPEQLLSEGNGFIVSIDAKNTDAFESLLSNKGVLFTRVGEFIDQQSINTQVFSVERNKVKEKWNTSLRDIMS